MGKKMIVLNGSPRKNGNTSALTASFRKGAEKNGNTVVEFFLGDMNINGCRGCFGGGKNCESPCVQKDDMEKIYPAYKEADIVVLASPLYYWSISGQLKTAFDNCLQLQNVIRTIEILKKNVFGLWRQRDTALRKASIGMTVWKSILAGGVWEKFFAVALWQSGKLRALMKARKNLMRHMN